MNFELLEEEVEKYYNWLIEHNKTCPNFKNEGASGGRLTFSFTPTNLGTVTKVTCACGEELDLTDYDW
jgi:hypothetical protein